MPVHSGKGCAKGKGQGQPNPGSGGSQSPEDENWQVVSTWSSTVTPVVALMNRVSGTEDHGSGPVSGQPSSSHTGGSRIYTAPLNSVNNHDPPDWYYNNPEFAHLISSEIPIPWGPLPRTRHGSIYLIDECPSITGTTPRNCIKPEYPASWQEMRDQDFVEWRTWKFIRNWRVFTHWVLRYKHKKRLWHWYGEWLKVVKARGEDRPIDWNYWNDLPPGRALEGNPKATFPNAERIDRSVPREPTDTPQANIMTRHRILPADDTVYKFFSRYQKSHR